MKIKTIFTPRKLAVIGCAVVGIVIIAAFTFFILHLQKTHKDKEEQLNAKLLKAEKSLSKLQSEDQYVINQKLQKEITDIQNTYKNSVTLYEQILDLKAQKQNTASLDAQLAESINLLSQRKYASAQAILTVLSKGIQDVRSQFASSLSNTAQNATTSNTPPTANYSRQNVKTDIGSYLVDIIAGDLSSTRVIVDTASEATCKDNCPVMSLGDYVSRNGAYAGINGSYFCPADYPSCAGKTNSFDTLLMNRNKVYFNSDNNVYSTVPAVIFLGSSVRFVGRSLDWGRDTGIDSMIANQPLLVSGKQVAFGGDGDPKKGSKGSRSFVGNIGNTVYIGVVHNVTVAEAAIVLKTLGMDNALNLDSGGSTALWYSGYKAGPGRGIPNAILFIRK